MGYSIFLEYLHKEKLPRMEPAEDLITPLEIRWPVNVAILMKSADCTRNLVDLDLKEARFAETFTRLMEEKYLKNR